MQFLSDDWLTALGEAASARVAPAEDPLADVSIVVEQVVVDGPRWRLVVDHGSLSVERPDEASTEPDVRLTSDRSTATAIAAGRRAALDAFITGDLVIGGDVRTMIEHREALEALGDLFARVRDATTFDAGDPVAGGQTGDTRDDTA